MRGQHADVDNHASQQTEDLMVEHEGLERRRVDLEQQYVQKKHEYIRLNNLEGELHAQMSTMRGSTSDQMMQNKQLEARVQQESQAA